MPKWSPSLKNDTKSKPKQRQINPWGPYGELCTNFAQLWTLWGDPRSSKGANSGHMGGHFPIWGVILEPGGRQGGPKIDRFGVKVRQKSQK